MTKPLLGLPRWLRSKESACEAEDQGSIPGLGSSSGEGNGNPFSVFLPGEFHGQISLASYSPWGRKELDMTEELTQSTVQAYVKSRKRASSMLEISR